jgi:hypothetical protein
MHATCFTPSLTPFLSFEEMVDVGMDIPSESNPMKCSFLPSAKASTATAKIGGKILPTRSRGYKLRALVEYPARAQRVMPDLRIAHIRVARKPDSGAVRLQGKKEMVAHQHIEHGSAREVKSVPFVFRALAESVHHHKNKRALSGGKSVFL